MLMLRLLATQVTSLTLHSSRKNSIEMLHAYGYCTKSKETI